MNISASNMEWVNETWKKIDTKMQKVAVRSREKIPYTTDENGVHDNRAQSDINLWTNGFWGGLLWLLYADTKNEAYRKTAEYAEKLMDKALAQHDLLHHDVGFMWHIMSGANYRLTGNMQSRTRNLFAASVLSSRFNIKGNYITAWNGTDFQGWTIIDCMMNIPLLYWATEETGNVRYKYVAEAHADHTMKVHIRPDGSVNHIVVHEIDSPEVIETIGGQGYTVGSCWSRGQAWALYGFILSYIHTKNPDYLDTAKRVANYFISACCTDWLPRVDFRAPAEPVYYDSTALCCAACGLIEGFHLHFVKCCRVKGLFRWKTIFAQLQFFHCHGPVSPFCSSCVPPLSSLSFCFFQPSTRCFHSGLQIVPDPACIPVPGSTTGLP